MAPLRLLSLLPPQQHAAALATTTAAAIDLTDCGGLHENALTATAEDVLGAAAQVHAATGSSGEAVSVDADAAVRRGAGASTALAVVHTARARRLRAIAVHGELDSCRDFACEFLSSLRALTQLTRLSLSGSAALLGPADALAETLPHLPQLRDLALRRVGLDAAASGLLAPALARASALTALDVAGNPMGMGGWTSVAAAGLPAQLAVLDARETFHSGNDAPCDGEFVPLSGELDAPESLYTLAHALRACSQLERLRVGPSVMHLIVEGLGGHVHWGVLRSVLTGVRELGGAGDVGFLPSLTALTALTWFATAHAAPQGDEHQLLRLSRLSQLSALRLTYSPGPDGAVLGPDGEVVGPGPPAEVIAGPDLHHGTLLLAVGALRGLTALGIHVQLGLKTFGAQSGVEVVVEHVRLCTRLRTLDLRLVGSGVGDDGEGSRLGGLSELTSLDVFSLQVNGAARWDHSGFALHADEGLAFAPASLQELTLDALYEGMLDTRDTAVTCTRLHTLRVQGEGAVGRELARAADAIARCIGRLECLVEVQIVGVIHDPYVLSLLAALRASTALEVVRVCAGTHAFPRLVLDALAGRTALRQLTIVHDYVPGWDKAYSVLRDLQQFSRLQRVGLYRQSGMGAPVRASVGEVAQALARMPCLALVIANINVGDWDRAEELAGRRVQRAVAVDLCVDVEKFGKWII